MSDPLKKGDIVNYTSPEVIKRKWWQFWKERYYYSGRMVTQRYIVGDTICSGINAVERIDDS